LTKSLKTGSQTPNQTRSRDNASHQQLKG